MANLVPGPSAKYRLIEREHLEELATSLLQGQQEPLIARPRGTPGTPGARLQVVVGERRRQALLLAGIPTAELVIERISENEARRLSAEHNAPTSNPLERAEGVLRTIIAKLSTRHRWKDVTAAHPSQLHAARSLIKASIRKDKSGIRSVCDLLGHQTQEFEDIFQDALNLYYGEHQRDAKTFAAGDALLVTYPESLRAKLRLSKPGKFGASHAHAVNQVLDPTLRDELLLQAIAEDLSVAAVRILRDEANLNGRLDRDPAVAQLDLTLKEARRALAKRQTALSPASLTKASRLAADLSELLRR